MDWVSNPITFWIWVDFILFLLVFGVSLKINFNFNTIMVGSIYLIPLIPWGLSSDNALRFLMVSFQNTLFGIIELVIFVITVQKSDVTFDKQYIKQLLGHTSPIAASLIGLSYVSRLTSLPMAWDEFIWIGSLFLVGSILRVMAVYQIGSIAFKFDIVFREKQKLKTDQFYGWMRHPSYTSMMIVILAYALNTYSWIAGILGMVTAWFGFQYRIHHEEKALSEKFGQEYFDYRSRTGMWLPKII